MTKTRKNRKCDKAELKTIDTMYSKVFELLGPMVVLHANGKTDDIKKYMMVLECLKNALEYRSKHVKEKNLKAAVKEKLKNVLILIEHAKKDFK